MNPYKFPFFIPANDSKRREGGDFFSLPGQIDRQDHYVSEREKVYTLCTFITLFLCLHVVYISFPIANK